MLIVAFEINETLVANVEKEAERGAEGIGCSALIVIILTVAITGINVTWLVFQYKWFGCSSNIPFMIATITACVICYAIIFLRTRSDASILTSAIVSLYFIYL